VKSGNVIKRILWQNINLSKFVLKNGAIQCLEPVYSKPILFSNKVKFVTVIHDLEALHYPRNHSVLTNIWLRLSWFNTVRTSSHIIAISNFVRNDIINRYNIDPNKITTIYNPIAINSSEKVEFSKICKNYNIEFRNYYYTVSKLNPHKNLSSLIKVFGEIKKRRIKTIPCKLLISGVNGGMAKELNDLAKEYSLTEEIILTGYVENDVRNTLCANAKAFLFPSIFEGFGMPPVEAMCLGTPVITTKRASIPEVTQNSAKYVQNPYDVGEWIDNLVRDDERATSFNAQLYFPKVIAEKYLKILSNIG
jgi:glycosyltransferase involved in cell wall biosynthesis